MPKKPVRKFKELKPKDKITLNKPYESLQSERFIDEKREIAEVHLVENTQKGEKFIRLLRESPRPDWKNREWVWKKMWGINIKKAFQLEKLYSALRKIAKWLGWDKIKLPEEIKDKEMEGLKERLAEAEKRKVVAETEIKSLQDKIQEYEKARLKDKLPLMEKQLENFKNLVNNFKENGKDEEDVQVELFNSPWLLGLEYANKKPKQKTSAKGIVDFLMARYGKLEDAFELKLPSHKLFDKEGKMTPELGRGISQIANYTQDIARNSADEWLRIRTGLNQDILNIKPFGFLIIGRCLDKETRLRLELLNSYLHGIKVLSYDDIIERAEITINNLKSSS